MDDCLDCRDKACKREGRDCAGLHEGLLARYREPQARDTYRAADGLVSGGRAGSLSRLEEIAAFCRARGLGRLALAYCFSAEAFSRKAQEYLRGQGLQVSSYRCSLGGVRQAEIDPALSGAVGCDPIGQALAINRTEVDLVVEIALCLGHDLLFHRHLERPLTVLLVKDRRFANCPQRLFDEPATDPKSAG